MKEYHELQKEAREARIGADRMALGLPCIPDRTRGDMDEIERLQTENWQLKGALGYEVPGHIPPGDFKCGLCEARAAEIERLEVENKRLRISKLISADRAEIERLTDELGATISALDLKIIENQRLRADIETLKARLESSRNHDPHYRQYGY